MVLTQPFTSKSDQGTDTVEKILWERKAISDLTDPFTVSLHKHLYQQNGHSRNCFKWPGYWRALEIRSSYLKGSSSLHNSQTTLPNMKMKITLNPQLIFFFSSKLQISWLHILIHLTSPPKILATRYIPLIANSPVSIPPMSSSSQTWYLLWQYSKICTLTSRTTSDLLLRRHARHEAQQRHHNSH